MAGGAELGSLVDRPHDGGRVAIQMRQNLAIRDRSRDRRAGLIDQNSRNSHDKATGAACVHLLDRVADGAGHAVLIVRAFARRGIGQGTGDQRDRVVAALAVPRIGNAFLRSQQVHVLQIVGDPVRVRMGGLSPLRVRLLMAVPAILGGGKGLWIQEGPGVRRRVRGQKRGRLLMPELVVLVGRDFCVVSQASRSGIIGCRTRAHRKGD